VNTNKINCRGKGGRTQANNHKINPKNTFLGVLMTISALIVLNNIKLNILIKKN
jgi:hypothetical protein